MKNKINTHKEYIKNGIEYPSVTNIIKLLNKEGLVYWANHLGFKRLSVDDVLYQSAEVGTYTHYLCECLLTDANPLRYNAKNKIMLNDVASRYISFKNFLKDNNMELIFYEKSFISEQYKFAGTLDFYGYINGNLTLLDFKTSKGFYDTMFIQLAAYNMLLNENNYYPDYFSILRVMPDKCYIKTIDKKKILIYERIFKLLLELYYVMNEL